jgi:Tfp pilus assembly protein PilE
MTDSPAPSAAATSSEAAATRPRWLFGRTELIIVILLGVVSLGIAYTSFESSLYDGNTQSAYSKGNNNETEAESLYLEANQQYVQDGQTLAQLAQLRIAADAGDTVAAKQYDRLKFMDVSDDLGKAMTKAAQKQAAHPKTYVDPQEDKAYQAALFGDYADKANAGVAKVERGDRDNGLGDRLTLSTVLMAIPLFLLGVAAVIRRPRSQVALAIIGMVIFVFAGALAATVPFVWL